VSQYSALLGKFVRHSSGALAPLFALSAFALVGAVGLAVDAARSYGGKSHLQAAVDSAVLATARRLAENPSTDVNEVFTSFLTSARPDWHDMTIGRVSVVADGSKVTAEVEASVPTLFMGVVGQDQVDIATRAIAGFGVGEMELVMALDTTGSMEGAKIDALKSAARDLVDTLKRASKRPDLIKFGLVPFAEYVNVGDVNRNASWIDVPADYTENKEYCGDTYPNATSSNCRMETGTCSNDGVSYSCSYEVCDWDLGTPVYQCSIYTNSHAWNGCVGSRNYPLNVKDEGYGQRIPGLLNVSCPAAPIMQLTNDHSAVLSAIDGMSASGATYIPAGLAWAWRVLSPKEPFSQSNSGANPKVKRYVVLMTDGENTRSPTYPEHNGADIAHSNQLTREVCANIKADNISIYAIAFQVTDPTIKSILEGCASSAAQFYDAGDNVKLMSAFEDIGVQISALRLQQ